MLSTPLSNLQNLTFNPHKNAIITCTFLYEEIDMQRHEVTCPKYTGSGRALDFSGYLQIPLLITKS